MGCSPFRLFTFTVTLPCLKSITLRLLDRVLDISKMAATGRDIVITSGVSSPTTSCTAAMS